MKRRVRMQRPRSRKTLPPFRATASRRLDGARPACWWRLVDGRDMRLAAVRAGLPPSPWFEPTFRLPILRRWRDAS